MLKTKFIIKKVLFLLYKNTCKKKKIIFKNYILIINFKQNTLNFKQIND